MKSLGNNSSSSIRRAASSKAEQKAIYRFLNNENVMEEELIEVNCEHTSTLCKGRNVLVLNDTTEINLQKHSGRIKPANGIGPVGKDSDIGFFAHLGLVVDVDELQAIGYSSINLWSRDIDKENKEERQYAKLPVEEKESYKWIKCAEDSKKVLSDAASVTIVGDRESDIYELFTDVKKIGIEIVARNRVDRKTTEGKKLYEILGNTDIAGSYKIDILGDKRKNTTNREATLSVKFVEVNLQKPSKKGKDGREDEIKITVVEVCETEKSDGVCWRLLTSHSVSNFEEAVQIVEWYQMRWYVEQVFRLLKNKGFQIENSELCTGWALRKLTIMQLQNVLKVMQMLIAYEGTTEKEDAGLVFNESEIECLELLNKKYEGKTEKLKNPYKPNSLKWGTWIIARVGGWSGYKSQRPPGPITIKNGLDRFNLVYIGWMLQKDVGTQ